MLGIAVSIVGVIGGIALFVLESQFSEKELGPFVKVFGGVLLILLIPYLIMWIILKIKTSEQDITGIERIGKFYTYVSGSLEIIGMIARILLSIIGIRSGIGHYLTLLNMGYIFGSAMYVSLLCLPKISRNKSKEQQTAWHLPGIPPCSLHPLHDSFIHCSLHHIKWNTGNCFLDFRHRLLYPRHRPHRHPPLHQGGQGEYFQSTAGSSS